MFRVMVLFALCALVGCSQAQLEHQTDSFNRASGNSISEHALLNAVRSSLDMPMSFTKLLKFTAGNMASASVAPKLPFGPDASQAFDLAPSLAWSGGVSQIEYADANNSGAIAKLNENLQYDTLDRYAYQNFNPVLLMSILVEHVEINGGLLVKLYAQRQRKCPHGSSEPICGELERMASLCQWPQQIFGGALTLPGGYSTTTIENRADSKCSFLKFQAFRYLLALSGYWSDAVTAASDTMTAASVGKPKPKTPESAPLDASRKRTEQVIGFEEADMHASYERIERDLDKDFKKKKTAGKRATQQHALKFAYRSPKSLLAYLGELIALQNFSKDRYVPEIIVGKERRQMTVFRVIRRQPTGMKVALSIRGPDGEVYVVPQPDYGSEVRDQTLRVLALAGELVNGALSDKDFPAPASVVVRAF